MAASSGTGVNIHIHSYQCCQCHTKPGDGFAMWRTFADDAGASVGDPQWRLCRECYYKNEERAMQVIIGMLVVVLTAMGWSYIVGH